MKVKFIIFVSIISFLSAKGQGNDIITGKFYITNIDVVVSELNILDTKIVANSKYIARRGTKFTAYEIKENNLLVIQFWKYKDDVQSNPKKKIMNYIAIFLKKQMIDTSL